MESRNHLQNKPASLSSQSRIAEISEILLRGIHRLQLKENPQNSQILLASQVSPSTANAGSMSYSQPWIASQVGYHSSSNNFQTASYL